MLISERQYEDWELEQVESVNTLEEFTDAVINHISQFYLVAKQSIKVDGVPFIQVLLTPEGDSIDRILYTSNMNRWLRILEAKNNNKYEVVTDTTEYFGNREMLIAACYDNEMLEKIAGKPNTGWENRADIILDKALDCGDFGNIAPRLDVLDSIDQFESYLEELSDLKKEWEGELYAPEYKEQKDEILNKMIEIQKKLINIPGVREEFKQYQSLWRDYSKMLTRKVTESVNLHEHNESKVIDLPILSSKDESIEEHFKKFMKQSKAREKSLKKKSCCSD